MSEKMSPIIPSERMAGMKNNVSLQAQFKYNL